MYSIGMDIGGMSAKIGLVSGETVVSEKIIPTSNDLEYSSFVEKAGEVVKQLAYKEKIDKLGISSCGLIDSKKGAIVYSNNIQWENKNIVYDIGQITGLPVKIANDAKCAALAEAVYGAGKEYERVCMITLGTGVGGAFITNKRLEEGNSYTDADGILGHITVEKEGRQCTCGRKGCLEAYSSATGIIYSYKKRTGLTISAKEVFEKAQRSELAAKETIEEFMYYLAEGLTSLTNVLRPEVITIGGGVAKSADMFLPFLNTQVNRQIYGGLALPVQIVAARLGNEAGMIGAALL